MWKNVLFEVIFYIGNKDLKDKWRSTFLLPHFSKVQVSLVVSAEILPSEVENDSLWVAGAVGLSVGGMTGASWRIDWMTAPSSLDRTALLTHWAVIIWLCSKLACILCLMFSVMVLFKFLPNFLSNYEKKLKESTDLMDFYSNLRAHFLSESVYLMSKGNKTSI